VDTLKSAVVYGGRLDDGIELISKPYRRERLARRLRRLLTNLPDAELTSQPRPPPDAPGCLEISTRMSLRARAASSADPASNSLALGRPVGLLSALCRR